MAGYISNLNKAFESRVRLGIMSILTVNEYAEFNTIKNMMEVTDGNLASHLKALEKLEYITAVKSFVGRKPNTRYYITDAGRADFRSHIEALGALPK